MARFKITKRQELTLDRAKTESVKKLLADLMDINNRKINPQLTTSDETGSHPMSFNELQDFNQDYLYALCDILGLDEVYLEDNSHEPD